jgi:hypothetical protein
MRCWQYHQTGNSEASLCQQCRQQLALCGLHCVFVVFRLGGVESWRPRIPPVDPVPSWLSLLRAFHLLGVRTECYISVIQLDTVPCLFTCLLDSPENSYKVILNKEAYRVYTKEWCYFKSWKKMYFSSYTSITYTANSCNCLQFLMRYLQLASQTYCGAAGPVWKMVSIAMEGFSVCSVLRCPDLWLQCSVSFVHGLKKTLLLCVVSFLNAAL